VLMGKPASKIACTLRFRPSSAGIWKSLCISAFTHRALWSALRVYARKRIDMMPDVRIVKLLIQCAFTLADRTQGPVYRQHPIWG
jgi:hypothetical protein